MRLRIVTAAAVAALAATSLAGCRTNVGYAATIDGTRYSESDISDYLTPDAEPVAQQDASGSQVDEPVRSFVVGTIITDKLYTKVAARLPGGAPSADVLARLRTNVLRGSSVDAAVQGAGIRGYTSAFNNLLVRQVVITQYLRAAQSQGIDIQAAAERVPFSVSVNPRYGVWNAKTRSFDGLPGAGAPAFLSLQPKAPSAAAATPGQTGG